MLSGLTIAGAAHTLLAMSGILIGSIQLLRPKRDLSRPTLYSINFIYQRDFVKPLHFADLNMIPFPSKSPGAIYDLNFFMVQRADGWRLSCEYNTDLYSAQSVNRMIGQLRNLLEQIAAGPDGKLSSFVFPNDLGDPLPALAPSTSQASLASSAAKSERNGRPSFVSRSSA